MTKSIVTLSVVALVSIPFAAKADLILGKVTFGGDAMLTSTAAQPGSISFLNNAFTVGAAAAQQGGFTALAGTTGTIQNITNPPDATDTPLMEPFITFAAAPNITIELTLLEAGIDGVAGCEIPTAAPGQVCTPAPPVSTDQSPFNLQND